MIKQLGTKLYFNKTTGDVLLIVGDMQGYVRETSFEEDVTTYAALQEQAVENIGLKSFEFGVYGQLSEGFNQVRVNVQTGELEFSYVAPELPSAEEQLSDLDAQIAALQAKKAEMEAKIANTPEVLL